MHSQPITDRIISKKSKRKQNMIYTIERVRKIHNV